MDHVDIDGMRVAYERTGSGPALVLLHGILADHRDWRPQVRGLSDTFDVTAWDAPGCGGSSDPSEGITAATYADLLASFLARLGVTRPHVLGLSWGSGLALELYRRHPIVPASLILCSAYAGWKGSLPDEEVRRRLAQVERESTMDPADFVPGWMSGLLTEAAPVSVRDEVISIMSDFHPVGYRAMAHAFAELDLRPVLPTISIPTLLLYGEVDQRSPLSVARSMHAAIPDAELVVLPGVGHLANLEAPVDFNAAVRAFLARHSSSGAAPGERPEPDPTGER
jgi:pimeloyl-ACP methyl ester carboxylesterase